MVQQTSKILMGTALGFLALAVCATSLPAQAPPQAPGSAALLIAESTNVPEGWAGPATLWIDGVEWRGTGTVGHTEGVVDDFSWHGTEIQSYDFGELGTFKLSAISRTTFDVVESDYRWHTYTAAGRISEGTGAFAEAQGIFNVDGYTRWFLDGSAPATAWYSGPGRVYGLSTIPEPSGLALLSIGVLSLLAGKRQQWPRPK